MELQPYTGGDNSQALALYQAKLISPEEREKRVKAAEELDIKLRHIVEDVPDRLYHTMGSNAGAGSGEFHTYRASRRREQERLSRIDEEYKRAEEEKDRMEKLTMMLQADEERTAKRRAKRQKKKDKQRLKKQKTEGSADGGNRNLTEEDNSGSESEKDGGPPIEQAPLD